MLPKELREGIGKMDVGHITVADVFTILETIATTYSDELKTEGKEVVLRENVLYNGKVWKEMLFREEPVKTQDATKGSGAGAVLASDEATRKQEKKA